MRCIHCDRNIPDDSMFCPYCGQDVEENQSLDELQDQILRQLSREVTGKIPSASWDREERREYMRGRSGKQSKRYLGIIGLVIVIMAFLMIAIWIVFTTMDANERRLKEDREQAVKERQAAELEQKKNPGKKAQEDDGPEENEFADDGGEIKMSFVSEPGDFGEYYKLHVGEATASSVITQEGTDNSAGKAVDGNEKTSWQEGAPGDGIGESLHLELEKPCHVKYMSFQLGNWNSWEYYDGNNRPKELEITVGDVTQTVTFPDGKTEYWVEFSRECPAEEVELVIKSVYEGSQWDDTCIAEIGVYGRGN